MATKLYQIFCNHCAYKKLTDGSDLSNLQEIKTCKDCGGLRQFKCPKCGYLLRVTKARTQIKDDSMNTMDRINDEQEDKLKRQKEAQQRIVRERRRQENANDGDERIL